MKGGWYGRSSSNGSYAAKGIFAPVLYVLYSALNTNLYPALCSQPTSINMFANVWNWLEIRLTSEEKKPTSPCLWQVAKQMFSSAIFCANLFTFHSQCEQSRISKTITVQDAFFIQIKCPAER